MLVLNHGGRAVLGRYLPALIRASTFLGHSRATLSVVDNSEGPEATAWLQHIGGIGIWHGPNRGLASFTPVVRSIKQPVVILCNNDVAPEPDAFARLVDTLRKHPGAFGVGPRVTSLRSGAYEGCGARLRFLNGLVGTELVDHTSADPILETVSAGVVLAVWREKFLALGGFSDAYFPGRYEDLELCVRARARGWPTLFDRSALVHHGGSEAFRAVYRDSHLRYLDLRNAHLFMLRNASGRLLWLRYLPSAAIRLVLATIGADSLPVGAWLEALRRYAEGRRTQVDRKRVLDERFLLEASTLPGPVLTDAGSVPVPACKHAGGSSGRSCARQSRSAHRDESDVRARGRAGQNRGRSRRLPLLATRKS